jgi:hypothetical protein
MWDKCEQGGQLIPGVLSIVGSHDDCCDEERDYCDEEVSEVDSKYNFPVPEGALRGGGEAEGEAKVS